MILAEEGEERSLWLTLIRGFLTLQPAPSGSHNPTRVWEKAQAPSGSGIFAGSWVTEVSPRKPVAPCFCNGPHGRRFSRTLSPGGGGAGELQRSWLRREACVCGSAVDPRHRGSVYVGSGEKELGVGFAGHRASAGDQLCARMTPAHPTNSRISPWEPGWAWTSSTWGLLRNTESGFCGRPPQSAM